MFTKQQAIARVNEHLGSRVLIIQNTHFANIGKFRTTWWFDIPLKKFSNDLNLLLNKSNGFFWLKIPANTFKNLDRMFAIRQELQCVDLTISSNKNDRYMIDIRYGGTNYDFSPYIQYEFNQM